MGDDEVVEIIPEEAYKKNHIVQPWPQEEEEEE